MARLIDADALSEELSTLATMITGLRAGTGVLREYMTEYRKSVLRIVDEQPTVDAVPVVHCAWVNVAGCRTICNHCGEYPLYDYFGRLKLSNNCPNCGAKMDLEEKNL